MIGSGLKKLAAENGMKVAKGVAYGSLRGYAATLSEGNGYKLINLSTTIPDPAKLQALKEEIQQRNVEKEFRVRILEFNETCVSVMFNDTVGTMKKIRGFIDWFSPLLDQSGATEANICPQCGCEIAQGKWMLVAGCAHHLHSACAERIRREIQEEEETRKQERTGSYVSGAVGAFLGALIGAVVWGAVLVWGYVAALVGFLIGWLAEKGYRLMNGRQGKGKVLILCLAVVIGVLAGTFGAYGYVFADMIGSGDLPGFTYGDIPYMIVLWMTRSEEFARAVGGEILGGILMAALGVYGLLIRAGKESAGVKLVDLE